jgi:hypothetical protein
VPIPAAAGRPECVDDEYERKGTANLCMMFEPLAGRRWVKVMPQCTAVDFAQLLREVIEEQYPQAEKIVLVMDNPHTHKPASLYQAFEPAEAQQLLDWLEMHYTPKHESWLNIAETELSGLMTQCLARRIRPPNHSDPGSYCLGAAAQWCQMPGRLAVQDAGCPNRTKVALPIMQLC